MGRETAGRESSLAFFLHKRATEQSRAGYASFSEESSAQWQHPVLPKWGGLRFAHCLQLATSYPSAGSLHIPDLFLYSCVGKAMDPVTPSNWPCVLGLSLVFCGTLGISRSSFCSWFSFAGSTRAEGWLGVPGAWLSTSSLTA